MPSFAIWTSVAAMRSSELHYNARLIFKINQRVGQRNGLIPRPVAPSGTMCQASRPACARRVIGYGRGEGVLTCQCHGPSSRPLPAIRRYRRTSCPDLQPRRRGASEHNDRDQRSLWSGGCCSLGTAFALTAEGHISPCLTDISALHSVFDIPSHGSEVVLSGG